MDFYFITNIEDAVHFLEREYETVYNSIWKCEQLVRSMPRDWCENEEFKVMAKKLRILLYPEQERGEQHDENI